MKHRVTFLMFLVLGFGLSIVSAQTESPVKRASGGVLNGKATSLPIPAYPAAAKAVGASGAVNVQVVVDEQGNVVSTTAVSGHPLLRQAAAQAAVEAKFNPTLLSGQPVSITGILVYNFAGATGETNEKPLIIQRWSGDGFLLGFAETKGVGGKIRLPAEFSSEQEQLQMLVGLSPEEQKIQILSILPAIKSKLNAADLWRFEFGLAKGRIFGNFNDENSILLNLAKFKELAANKAEGILQAEINSAVELSKIADKGKLTGEDKQAIIRSLK